MDPNATLELILLGIADMSRPDSFVQESGLAQTIEACRALADWLEKGGMPPKPKAHERLRVLPQHPDLRRPPGQ